MGRIWLLSGTQIRSITRSSWWITHAAQSVYCINGKCITWRCVTQEGNMMRSKQSTLSGNCYFCGVGLFLDNNPVMIQISWQHSQMWYMLTTSEFSFHWQHITKRFSWCSFSFDLTYYCVTAWPLKANHLQNKTEKTQCLIWLKRRIFYFKNSEITCIYEKSETSTHQWLTKNLWHQRSR